jgi:hypothetical protein
MKSHKLKMIADLAKLTPEELQRLIPDLVLWHYAVHPLVPLSGVDIQGFTWTDDGETKIKQFRITVDR